MNLLASDRVKTVWYGSHVMVEGVMTKEDVARYTMFYIESGGAGARSATGGDLDELVEKYPPHIAHV